jgi:O-antigen/teichoic acid export membrane protein
MILPSNKNIFVLADQAVFSGGSFLLTMLLARILGAYNFGLFTSLTLFNYALISVFNAVIINPFQVSLERIEDKKSYVSFNFWSQLALVVITTLVMFIAMQVNSALLSNWKDMGLGLVIFIIGFVMQDYFRKLFLAQAFVKLALLIDVISTGLSCGVLFFALWHPSMTLSQMVLFLGLSYLPAIVLSVLVIQPGFKAVASWKAYFKMHVDQGKWLLISTITQWWSGNLFVVASGMFLGLKALGAFRLVQSLFGILNVLLQALENYALPEATRLFVHSNEAAKSYLKSISLKSAALFGVVLLVLFIFSTQVITLAGGAQYIEYAYVVKGMCILYVFIFIGYPIRMAIRMLVLNKVFFSGYLLSFVFSILSFNYLLSAWNIYGAIFGLIISQLIVVSYWQYTLYKKQFVLWR